MSTNKFFSSSDDDEQLARDMELALALQEKEARNARKHAEKSEMAAHQNGFVNGTIAPNHMLFISAELDGRLVQMLVDSGASCSAMTVTIMHELGLADKLSTDIHGKAGGVGHANIVGVVENVILTVGHVEFSLFFIVLDSPNRQLILGLDTMRRFKCMINLDENVLTFGGKNGVSVPFMDQECAAEAVERMTETTHRRVRQHGHKSSTKGVLGLFGRKK